MGSSKVFLAALLISGFTSMAYEVVLIREMAVIVGPTDLASGLVLAAFMAGLALGAYILGERSERQDPVRLLVIVELVLALCGLVIFPALRFLRGGHAAMFTMFASFGLMMTPAFFMGGEIPIVSKILNRDQRTARWVGAAYASDTAGGILGSLATGLVLLPALGSLDIFLIGSALNALAAMIVYRFGR